MGREEKALVDRIARLRAEVDAWEGHLHDLRMLAQDASRAAARREAGSLEWAASQIAGKSCASAGAGLDKAQKALASSRRTHKRLVQRNKDAREKYFSDKYGAFAGAARVALLLQKEAAELRDGMTPSQEPGDRS